MMLQSEALIMILFLHTRLIMMQFLSLIILGVLLR